MVKKIPEHTKMAELRDLSKGAYKVRRLGEYTGWTTRYECHCSACDHVWVQKLGHLLSGTGCKKCKAAAASERLRANPDDLVNKINEIGAFRFIKWQSDYINYKSIAVCECRHGHEVSVSALGLIYDRVACPACKKSGVHWMAEYKERITQVSGGSLLLIGWSGEGVGTHAYASVKCKVCNLEWETKARNLLSGSGCPSCANYGYQYSGCGTLYALRSECGTMVKIGISNQYKRRHRELKASTPFGWECIGLYHNDDGSVPAKLEKYLHSMMNQVKFDEAFDGCTEWMEWDDRLPFWFSGNMERMLG